MSAPRPLRLLAVPFGVIPDMIWLWLLKVVVWDPLTLKATYRVNLAADTLDDNFAFLPGTGLRAPQNSEHVKGCGFGMTAGALGTPREASAGHEAWHEWLLFVDLDDAATVVPAIRASYFHETGGTSLTEHSALEGINGICKDDLRRAASDFPMVEASLAATSSHGGLSPVLRSTSLVEGSSGCSSSQVVAEGGASAGDAYNVVTSQLGMKYWCRCGIAVVADDSSLCLRCMASVERAQYGDADLLDVVPLMLKVVGGSSLLAEGHAEGNGCSVCEGPGRREAVVRIHIRSALIDGEGCEAHRRCSPYVQPGPSEPHRSIWPWARSSNAKDKYGFAMRNAEGAAPLKGELSQQLKLFTNVALHAADPIVTRRIVSSNRVRQLLSLIIRYHSK